LAKFVIRKASAECSVHSESPEQALRDPRNCQCRRLAINDKVHLLGMLPADCEKRILMGAKCHISGRKDRTRLILRRIELLDCN
jgi:hypothetical protein